MESEAFTELIAKYYSESNPKNLQNIIKLNMDILVSLNLNCRKMLFEVMTSAIPYMIMEEYKDKNLLFNIIVKLSDNNCVFLLYFLFNFLHDLKIKYEDISNIPSPYDKILQIETISCKIITLSFLNNINELKYKNQIEDIISN